MQTSYVFVIVSKLHCGTLQFVLHYVFWHQTLIYFEISVCALKHTEMSEDYLHLSLTPYVVCHHIRLHSEPVDYIMETEGGMLLYGSERTILIF